MKCLDHCGRVARLGSVLIACGVFGGTLATGMSGSAAATAPSLRVLFLGDTGHHRPADRFKQLQPVLAKKGIELDYTEKLEDLNAAKLAGYE